MTAANMQARTTGGPGRSLAYLVSQYPMLSMIFIIREVRQLRALGFRIDVASIDSPDRPITEMAGMEAEEASRTYYVKQQGILGAVRSHGLGLLRRPWGYARGMALVLRLGGSDLRRLGFNWLYFTEALIVGHWMLRNGQDHVHVHLGSQSATVGMFVKVVFGFGLSLTIHGPDEFYDAKGQYLAEKAQLSDFVCCISHFARSQLMKLSPYAHWPKLEVSRLGIDPEVYAPRPFCESPEVFEILCVGRLVAAKGQHLLVDAVAELLREGRRVRLRLIGDGADRASLETQIRELGLASHIVLEGPVNQDRIREFYLRADCFALASFAEGIPVVLMEAMAMEIPCVTTHITGIPELIRHGQDGLLVAPSDREGLRAAIARLIDDPELRRTLGSNARQRVLEAYDLARNVQHLAGIFRARLAANV